MVQQILNVGAAPNDNTGDPLRTGMQKANANFTELYGFGQPTNWTPTFTCATPGDLAVTYGGVVGKWFQVGKLVTVSFSVTASAWTWTTASGSFQIGGLPVTPSVADQIGSMPDTGGMSNATMGAGFVDWAVAVNAGTNTVLQVICNDRGTPSRAFLPVTGIPSGGTPFIRGQITYYVP